MNANKLKSQSGSEQTNLMKTMNNAIILNEKSKNILKSYSCILSARNVMNMGAKNVNTIQKWQRE